MSLYSFVINNKTAGKFELLGATNRTFTTLLNKPGEASFQLNLKDSSIGPGMISLAYSELWIYRNNVLIWAGELTADRINVAGDTITYNAKGWSDLLSKIEIGTNALPVTYTATDASTIASTAIAGAFGITNGTLATSSPHDRTAIQYVTVKDLIDGLSNDHIQDGIDWEITPTKQLNTFYPAKGQQLDAIVFQYGVNVLDCNVSDDATLMVNEVTALGAGDGTSMLTAIADSNAYLQSTYGLRQTSLAFKDISEAPTLVARASAELTARQIPQQVITIFSDASLTPGYGSYVEGDTIRLEIDRGLCQLHGHYRVYGRKVTISDEDQESIETYLNPQ